ncbi:MAG: formyltransferase family protein [Pseudomonadota bacterium]
MPERILLLTGTREAPHLAAFVRKIAPHLALDLATSRSEFKRLTERESLAGTRLLSFLSGIIVPPAVLERLDLAPYNIHPGPPAYPGLFPEAFALADGAREFGVTVHEMVAEIDAGPIVMAENFAISPGSDRLALVEAAEQAAVRLFATLAHFCVTSDGALPPLPVAWQGPRRTRADFKRLCARRPDLAHERDDLVASAFAR